MTKLNRNQNTRCINSLDDVAKIHLLAVFHSKQTFFAHSHSKRTFLKQEDGRPIINNLY